MNKKGLITALLSNPVILVVVAVIAIVFFASNYELSIFEPSTGNLIQYTASPDTFQDNAWDWTEKHPLPLSFSGEAKIGDYHIVTEQADKGTKYGEPHCSGNTCSGTALTIDENGCQLYDGLTPETKVCESGRKSASYRASPVTATCSNPNPTNCVTPRAECSCYGKLRDCLANQNDFSATCSIGSGRAEAEVTGYCTYKTTCGGIVQDVVYSGIRQCWSKSTIFYKGQQIEVIDWDRTRRSLHLNNGEESTLLNSTLG